MSKPLAQAAPPAWQTEELQDEWVDLEEEGGESDEEDDNQTYGTRSVSLTVPLSTHIHTNVDDDGGLSFSPNTSNRQGTFLVREDIPSAPLLPKTPGRQKKGIIKDFFSPLPLERMFEPPSPPTSRSNLPPMAPAIPSRLSQTHVLTDDSHDRHTPQPNGPEVSSPSGSGPSRFTFAVPRQTALTPGPRQMGGRPQAQSTPNPPFANVGPVPATDSRLRLFQFHYDTFTRDQLSAMVDSIAVNTPSGTTTTTSPATFNHGLSRVSEATGTSSSFSHLRSAKRVKLSPRTDFYGEGAGADATITRPKLTGKDYVGESRCLMQQIKSARDFSTLSTVASVQNSPDGSLIDRRPKRSDSPKPQSTVPGSIRKPQYLLAPEPESGNSSNTSGTVISKAPSSTASTYRQQAAALMDQIRKDMKGQKRLFSGETDASGVTAPVDETPKPALQPSSETIPVPVTTTEDVEPHIRVRHRQTSSINSTPAQRSKPKPSPRKGSPRKVFRQMSTPEKAERRLAEDISNLSIKDRHSQLEINFQRSASSSITRSLASSTTHVVPRPNANLLAPPTNLAPPSYPSSSVRANTNDDLNRFVSSSTSSGTTLTAASAPPFVKHAGPAHIRTIAPTDIPTLPDRLGDMLFDKVMMKWVKNTALATRNGEDFPTEEASEDPFGDIESLRDDSKALDSDHSDSAADVDATDNGDRSGEMPPLEEQSEMDEEELELMSFSTDDPSRVVDVMTGVETDEMEDGDQTTDSDEDQGDDDFESPGSGAEEQHQGYDSDEQTEQEFQTDVPSGLSHPPGQAVPATPMPNVPASATTPVIRSALKSNSVTPNSALKNPSRHKYRTPLQKPGHRRSVSFSDGKRDGPIRGLNTSISTDGEEGGEPTAQSALAESSAVGSAATGFLPSVRSKRIADMMDALVDTDSDGNESPSSKAKADEMMQSLENRGPNAFTNLPSSLKGNNSRRMFSSRSSSHSKTGQDKGSMNKANATFLTECSFGVAHDRLVEVITDVQPFEPHWEGLASIDLSKKKLESVARLKEFLPQLDALNLNSNQLGWLSGVPGTVRTLSVASNSLTGITSFSHLLNLENLDISRNDIDSLRQLSCLRHLRELKADGNKITSIDGLQHMDGLVKLSVQGNLIQSMDLTQYRWTRLEMLNISHNRLDSIYGLASLPSLIALNIDNNSLGELEVDSNMPRLRILRASGNRLRQLQVGNMPNLRTLYADNNSLSTLVKVDRLTKLENLSLRNQSGRGLNVVTRDIRDVKRLYLSGNPLRSGFLEEPCYNLVYLELAACRLTALPEELSSLVPNLRVLNLNYNFLEDARPLEGLTRLRKLTIIGSRLKGTKPLIRLLQRMPEVEMLDFRMNPCTLGWYLPLLVKDVPGALQPSEGGMEGKGASRTAMQPWQELDSKFRRDLPDESYIGRLAYRGLIMRACTRIRMLDGVEISEKERAKAHHLLLGILGKGKKSKGGEGE